MGNWESRQSVKYKFKIIPPAEPTFPSVNSFLDICIADTRLTFANTMNSRLKTHLYDSDHRAIIAEVSVDKDLNILQQSAPPPTHFLYKKCNWKKFRSLITRNNTISPPTDRNLSNSEIDENLDAIEANIRSALAHSSPKYKNRDYTDIYTNDKIRKLIKYKSFIISKIHKSYKLGYTTAELVYLKELLKTTKNQIEMVMKQNISKYWENKEKEINHQNTNTFFPKINKLFRYKPHRPIEPLKIEAQNQHWIEELNISSEYIINEGSHFNISGKENMANLMGRHYQEVNTPKPSDPNKRLHKLIALDSSKLKEEIRLFKSSQKHITHFSRDNSATNPIGPDAALNFFTSVPEITKTLKRIKGKTSTGIDGIPNIALKNLPDETIIQYTILFNNTINNIHFPKRWTTAIVIPILKKGQGSGETCELQTD